MVKVKKREKDNRTWYECPECGERDAFFENQNRLCTECSSVIPAIKRLIRDREYRIDYYLQ